MPSIRLTGQQIQLAMHGRLYRERHEWEKILTRLGVDGDGRWEDRGLITLLAQSIDEQIEHLGLPPYNPAECLQAERDYWSEVEAQIGNEEF